MESASRPEQLVSREEQDFIEQNTGRAWVYTIGVLELIREKDCSITEYKREVEASLVGTVVRKEHESAYRTAFEF